MRCRLFLTRAALCADQQIGQRQNFRARDHDAREEHDERQRPSGRRPQQHDALHDGVGLGAGGRGGRQHRQQVGRDVADCRGDQKGPGALETGALAENQVLVAARASPFVPRPERAAKAVRKPRSCACRSASRWARPRSRGFPGRAIVAVARRISRLPPIRSVPILLAGRSSPASRPAEKPALPA